MRYHPSPTPRTALLALLVVPLLSSPPALEAQARSVTWTEVSRLEMPGTLGALIRAMPGAMEERESTHGIHLAGSSLRQDDGSSSTIVDLEGGRYLLVDHEEQTVTVLTFEESVEAAREMAAVMNEAMAGAQEALDEARGEMDEAMAELRRAMDEAETELSFRLDTESTGETRNVNGMTAQRHLITAEIEARGPVQGVEGMDETEGGTVVFLVELWQTRDLPTADQIYEEWARRMAADPELQSLAAEMAASFEPVGGEDGITGLAMWDPRIAAGLAQVAEAIESMDGTTVRSTTTVAVVPDGVTLDREALFAWEPESMGDRLRAEAGDAAREAARDAARGAIRGIGRGLLGRRGGDDDPPADEAEAPAVRPLLRMISEKTNIRIEEAPATALDADLSGYTELTLQDLMERARRER